MGQSGAANLAGEVIEKLLVKSFVTISLLGQDENFSNSLLTDENYKYWHRIAILQRYSYSRALAYLVPKWPNGGFSFRCDGFV